MFTKDGRANGEILRYGKADRKVVYNMQTVARNKYLNKQK